MFLFYGSASIILAIVAIILAFSKNKGSFIAYISLALTALTLLDFYLDAGAAVNDNNMAYVLDVIPTVGHTLAKLTIASIILNAIPFVLSIIRKHKAK